MPFQPPFSTAGKWFAENMNSCRNNLSTLILYWIKQLNSLTPKSVPAGTKNSRSEGFLLAKLLKHTAHKHPHHDGAVSPSSAMVFDGGTYPTPGSLFGRGWTRPPSKGLVKNYKLQEKIIYLYCLSVNYNNRSPTVDNDSQNGIHCCRRATIIY